MEGTPPEQQADAPTSDDLFEVSVETRITCRGVPGPDAQATARQMVERALDQNPSISYSVVDVGEPVAADSEPADDSDEEVEDTDTV